MSTDARVELEEEQPEEEQPIDKIVEECDI